MGGKYLIEVEGNEHHQSGVDGAEGWGGGACHGRGHGLEGSSVGDDEVESCHGNEVGSHHDGKEVVYARDLSS